jgi:type I restriction enzyme S subunit
MSKYQSYTAYASLWNKSFPSHWSVLPMYALAKEKSICGCVDLPLLSVYLDVGVIPFSAKAEKRTNVTSKDLSKYQRVDCGDFVLNNQQAWRGSVGISFDTGIVSPAYIVLSMNDMLNSRYANYLLRSRIMVDQYLINSKSVGSIQRNIYWPTLKRTSVPVPPREEQDQIVRFLDWKVSSINKLINIKKKEIKAIDALKRSTVSHAITRGLTADAPMKYSGVKWLGDIPQRWYTVPLYAIAQVKSINNCIDLPLMSVYLDAGVVPFVEREEKRTNATSKDLTNYQRVDPGDFVLNNQQAWRGSVGVSFHSGIVSPAYIVLSLNNTLDSHYANYLFRSRCMVDQYLVISRGVGSIQRNLYWSALKRVVVPIPSKKEQMEIVEYLDGLNNKFDATIKKLTEEVAVLEEYKNKIIADTVTGKIDVRGIEIPEYEFVDEDADADNEDDGEEDTEEQED